MRANVTVKERYWRVPRRKAVGESEDSMVTSLKPRIEPGAVYSRQEAAEALGISLSTLKRLVKNGHLRVSKPNGMRRVFITGESILAMLNETIIERGA